MLGIKLYSLIFSWNVIRAIWVEVDVDTHGITGLNVDGFDHGDDESLGEDGGA